MKPKLNFKDISRFRFWSGIVIYSFFAFFVFNLFILLMFFVSLAKEISINFYSSLYSLPNYQYKFYLFFIAFYSICFSAVLLLSYWYNKPANKPLDKKRRRHLTYERSGFVASFIQFLFRLIILTFIFSYTSILQCLNIYADYKYVFVLMGIVVFLDLWIGFRRVFVVSLKYVFISFLAFLLLSLSLTFIRPYNDVEMLNYINKNSRFSNIQLAQIDNKFKTKNHRNDNYILFVNKDFKIFVRNNQRIKLENIQHFLTEYDDFSIYNKRIELFFDSRLKVKHFLTLKREFSKADKLKLMLMTSFSKSNCNPQNEFLTIGITPFYININFYPNSFTQVVDTLPFPPPPPEFEEVFIYDSAIVSIDIAKKLLSFDSLEIPITNLEEQLFKEKFEDKIFVIHYNNENTFQEYIQTYNQIRNSVYRNRDSFLLETTRFNYLELKEEINGYYGEPINENYKILYKTSKEKYPLRIIEKEIN